jgi:hypothetical protein
MKTFIGAASTRSFSVVTLRLQPTNLGFVLCYNIFLSFYVQKLAFFELLKP